MKKKLVKIGMAVILFTAVSCNGNFRFIISPIPPTTIVIRPNSPGIGYIWIDGEWFWNGRSYMWRDGYWTLPADGNVWVPGRWKARSGGWYWVPGHWRR